VRILRGRDATEGHLGRATTKKHRFTVPEVWRKIIKKNERQGTRRFDVLVCHHAVPANDNTYRIARACPECRVVVQQFADEHARSHQKPKAA
jgi:hypothetical protein